MASIIGAALPALDETCKFIVGVFVGVRIFPFMPLAPQPPAFRCPPVGFSRRHPGGCLLMAVIEMENKSIRTDYHDFFDLFGENVLVKLGRTQHIGSNFLKNFFWNAFGITGFDAVLTFGLADPISRNIEPEYNTDYEGKNRRRTAHSG